MLDELLIGGEISETSKKNVLKAIAAQDMLQEVSISIYHIVYERVIVYEIMAENEVFTRQPHKFYHEMLSFFIVYFCHKPQAFSHT